MDNWKSMLNADPIKWLLEDNNPSVKYFTLIDVLERAENGLEVRKTKEEIMKKGVVPKILAKQKDGGYWENSQDRESSGFSMWVSTRTGGGRSTGVIPCLTGNLVYSLIKLGYLKDERVQNSINWITTYQRFDDGIKDTPKDWPYERLVVCWGKHSCHMGVVKALKALAKVPLRIKEMRRLETPLRRE